MILKRHFMAAYKTEEIGRKYDGRVKAVQLILYIENWPGFRAVNILDLVGEIAHNKGDIAKKEM